MTIIYGKAIKLERPHIVSPCGYEGPCGYTERGKLGRATGKLSFSPKTTKAYKLKELSVDGILHKILRSYPSEYVNGMWTFLVLKEVEKNEPS